LGFGIVLALSTPAVGRAEPLTLADALARARATHPRLDAARAAEQEAAQRERQARAGFYPRIDVSEEWQRGDQPVFVFGSLLAERRFAVENFAIDALNHPAAVDNLRTSVGLEQLVFDGGATSHGVRAAELMRRSSRLATERASLDLTLEVSTTYAAVLRLESQVSAADRAIASAESDLGRARDRRDAGLATDADVLALDVHLAEAQSTRATALADLLGARARLNDAIGAPLDLTFELDAGRRGDAIAALGSIETLEKEALERRPDVRQAALAVELAENTTRASRAAWLPQVGVLAGWEFNGGSLASQSSSWLVGTRIRLNLFRGFADAARVEEARGAERRQRAERDRIERAARVEVRTAVARLDAALGRQRLGRATLARAREAERIVRDRYENGLATVTDLLRAADAVSEAESLDLTADVEAWLQAVTLDHAVGRQ
ncbi:MAG: TolC family protein, partial [Vicinamibacterales bacterium]